MPGALSSLLSGGGDVGSALVNDKRVDLLSFTGSEARGREVGMAVAGRFGQSILELGGNNVSTLGVPRRLIPRADTVTLFLAGCRCLTRRQPTTRSSIHRLRRSRNRRSTLHDHSSSLPPSFHCVFFPLFSHGSVRLRFIAHGRPARNRDARGSAALEGRRGGV